MTDDHNEGVFFLYKTSLEQWNFGTSCFTCDIIYPCCLSHTTCSVYYSRRFVLPKKCHLLLRITAHEICRKKAEKWKKKNIWCDKAILWAEEYQATTNLQWKPAGIIVPVHPHPQTKPDVLKVSTTRSRNRGKRRFPWLFSTAEPRPHDGRPQPHVLTEFVPSGGLHGYTFGRLWHYRTSVLCIRFLFIYLFIYLSRYLLERFQLDVFSFPCGFVKSCLRKDWYFSWYC